MSEKVAPIKKSARSEPPHSIESEMSVLGGLMLQNSAWQEIRLLPLKAEDFYRSDHQLIFQGIVELIDGGRPCDFVTLQDHFRALGRLEEIGGAAALGALAVDTYSVANIVAYAKTVRDRARLRRFIQVGQAISAMGFRPEGRSPEEVAEQAEEQLDGLLVEILQDGDTEAGADDGLHPSLPDLVKHYVLIYGTETIWDERRGRILALGPLRAASGLNRVKKWLGHPQRRSVHADNVTFDPGAKPRDGYVNMFRGLPMKPKAGDCGLIVQLLEHLCSTEDGGEEKPLTEWVLNWLAYPLQHLGAKMQTALLFHGMPGAGKNLLFKVLRMIYGEYYTEIGQAQLEFFRFNGWGSRKMMVIGNEVISRTELKHSEGQLRQWISEPTWQVDEKNLPLREEANHCNFVFLSNFVVPLSLGRRDRRMAVMYTPRQEKPAEFYADVAAQIAAGGAEAFLQQLLTRDLGDFNEHSKPPMTDAKRDLLDASAESYERFEAAWVAGDLPVPFRACATLDLYKAYKKWCEERGERSPVRDALFLASLRKRVRTRRKKYTVTKGGVPSVSEGMVFLPDDWQPQAGRTDQDALGAEIGFFRQQLHDWSYDSREAKAGEGSGEGPAP